MGAAGVVVVITSLCRCLFPLCLSSNVWRAWRASSCHLICRLDLALVSPSFVIVRLFPIFMWSRVSRQWRSFEAANLEKHTLGRLPLGPPMDKDQSVICVTGLV